VDKVNICLLSFSFVKGIDHLTNLCSEFQRWYNHWRPHMTIDGLRPDDVFYKNQPDKPGRGDKTVPATSSGTISARPGSPAIG